MAGASTDSCRSLTLSSEQPSPLDLVVIYFHIAATAASIKADKMAPVNSKPIAVDGFHHLLGQKLTISIAAGAHD